MALFGKKKDASGTAPDDTSAVMVADPGAAPDTDIDASPQPKRAKAPRAPKPSKSKSVKSGTAVGLNIGNQFIKAVEVTARGGDLTVTAMGAVPTPPESYTNGNVLSVSALSNAIKDLWRSAGIKSKVAITSVAGTGALVVRVIEVPKVTDNELKDMMRADADRYIPFPPSEVIMDFKALRDLPSDPDAPNMEVLLAAAQREIIDLHVKVVQSARLDPRAIDVETLSASRALKLEQRATDSYIDYNEVTGVVNLGATGAEISIMRGDVVVFTRVVPNGGNAITQAIADGLGLPFSDAERLKVLNADALAPAGYGAAVGGDDFGFGGGDHDFNFGGDNFSGNDLNSAFDDISANPTGNAAATDDPFDLDFFNQGPDKDEPGAGHAQKEGEDEPSPAFTFDFGDISTPTPAPKPAEPAKPEPTAPQSNDADPSPASFDFGAAFDEEFLPSVSEEASPSTSKGTSQLDDFSFDAADTTPLPNIENSAPATAAAATSTPATPAPTPTSSPFIPSAFDFDNFDLPGIQEEGLTTVSTPIEPTAPAAAPLAAAPLAAAPVASAPSNFAPQTPPPPTPADARPAPFNFDDDDLASKPETTPEEAQPTSAQPTATQPASSFDFALSEPFAPSSPTSEPAVTAPGASTTTPAAAPTEFTEEPLSFETTPSGQPGAADPGSQTPASTEDDFDLDSIFGEPAPGAAIAPTTAGATTAGATTTGAAPVAASAANDDQFDLSGIETDLGSFAGGFGDQADDFSAFGTGLDSGASTDAATLYTLIYPSLEELSNEVRRSLEFHLGRYPDATISKLILHGGGAKLRNLDVFFTQSLGVPTSVANPFAHLKVNTPKLPPEYATENGPICTVALGLALRDFVD